ncbi:MAG: ribonuclease HII [Flavobacteriia bacterium]|nr:MAG: ribonuclease HII [Flavobacteriia bacterium]
MLKLKINAHLTEAGTDEAGRGCLAGPVVAAAVILPDDFSHEWLNDSKQINEKQRLALKQIIETQALDYAVAFVSHKEIDQLNILRASITAMHRALDQLTSKIDLIAVDGNKFTPYKNIPFQTVIKGDATYQHIAAASILAKTYRDDYMLTLHKKHPHYGWDSNKGYPTKQHREAIIKYGATEFHRKSFRLVPEQLKLDL